MNSVCQAPNAAAGLTRSGAEPKHNMRGHPQPKRKSQSSHPLMPHPAGQQHALRMPGVPHSPAGGQLSTGSERQLDHCMLVVVVVVVAAAGTTLREP